MVRDPGECSVFWMIVLALNLGCIVKGPTFVGWCRLKNVHGLLRKVVWAGWGVGGWGVGLITFMPG